MCRILGIEVEEIHARALDEYDRVAMVDVQPGFFQERFEHVDLVIDHHPEDRTVQALLKDIRPAYGATSTILTEYLRAAEVKISQRLATALLYAMAKAVIRLADWRVELGQVSAEVVSRGIMERFLRALSGNGPGAGTDRG